MAYFAQVDQDGIVQQVISINDTDAPDPAPAHSEPIGQAFIAETLGLPGTWIQTSFNSTFRKHFAGPGYRYDADADVFIAPQPFPSWTLDANHDWQPPIPYPQYSGVYYWDEEGQEWVAIEMPEQGE